jgi:serine/threonine protein kinase
MARDLMDDTYYTSKGGKIPVKWTAPEALLYKKYSTASDVWSYAMVLYETWSVGLKPFQNLSNADVIARLQNHQCQAPPPGCPRAVYSIMVDCWNPEPHLRPTFDKVFRSLRAPQDELLYWTPEDVAGGRHLLRSSSSSHSFSDLQNKYITPQTGRH